MTSVLIDFKNNIYQLNGANVPDSALFTVLTDPPPGIGDMGTAVPGVGLIGPYTIMYLTGAARDALSGPFSLQMIFRVLDGEMWGGPDFVFNTPNESIQGGVVYNQEGADPRYTQSLYKFTTDTTDGLIEEPISYYGDVDYRLDYDGVRPIVDLNGHVTVGSSAFITPNVEEAYFRVWVVDGVANVAIEKIAINVSAGGDGGDAASRRRQLTPVN